MKKWIIYAATLLISVAALVLCSIFVGSSDSEDSSGSAYLRARVIEVGEEIEDEGSQSVNIPFTAKLGSGETVSAYQNIASYSPHNPELIEAGDSVILSKMGDQWYFAEYLRSDYIIALTVFFALLLVLFGRFKGVNTIISLALTCLCFFFVFIPAVVGGRNIYLWAVFSCVYIIVTTLLIVNGMTALSLCSAVGCIGGVAVSSVLILISSSVLSLTGFVDESSIYLMYIGSGSIDLKAVTYAAVIIGSVGAVMDVAVNISASLHEIALKLGKPDFKTLLGSGLTIGRDIMGTMSNTLVLAYIGSSLSVVLLLYANCAGSMLNLFNREMIVTELLTILIGSIGILLTIPLSSLICAAVYPRILTKNAAPDEKIENDNWLYEMAAEEKTNEDGSKIPCETGSEMPDDSGSEKPDDSGSAAKKD